MFVKFLRENVYASAMLLVARLYLGWQWLHAGWGKITGPEPFSAAGMLGKAIEKPVVSHDVVVYPTYTAFIKNIIMPNIDIINFVIPYGEFLVGLGLILGCLTTAAMFFGMLMNFMFMLAGTVSSNPWMIFFSIFVIVAGANAGRLGADYYVLPYLRSLMTNSNHKGHAKSA